MMLSHSPCISFGCMCENESVCVSVYFTGSFCFIFMSTKVSCAESDIFHVLCFALPSLFHFCCAVRGLLKDRNWAHTRTQIHTCQRNLKIGKERVKENSLHACVCLCGAHIAHTGISKYTWNVFYCTCSTIVLKRAAAAEHYNYNQTKIDTVNACLLQLKNQIVNTLCRSIRSAEVVVVVVVATAPAAAAAFHLECHIDIDGLLITWAEQMYLTNKTNMWRAELTTGTTKHWLETNNKPGGCCQCYVYTVHTAQERIFHVFTFYLFSSFDLNGIACEYARMKWWEKIV